MPIARNTLDPSRLNLQASLPYDDFRRNERGELGTRTATLDARGIAKLRANWLYRA